MTKKIKVFVDEATEKKSTEKAFTTVYNVEVRTISDGKTCKTVENKETSEDEHSGFISKSIFTQGKQAMAEILSNIDFMFLALKKEIDKYPNVFNLEYSKEDGYCIVIDLDCLEQCLASQVVKV